jgi:hypothetical protein
MANADAASERTTTRQDHRSAGAWMGVLTGPIAWFAQLLGNWILGEVIGCSPANRGSGSILGFQVNVVAAIANVVLLGLTILAGLLSYRDLRSVRSRTDDTPGHRATWLATAGVMTSMLFAALIVTSFIPISLVRGCS